MRLKSAFLGIIVVVNSADKENCIKWGNTFDVSLNSKNVRRDCQVGSGRRLCCAAVHKNNTEATRGVGIDFVDNRSGLESSTGSIVGKLKCVLYKEYISSPQEIRDNMKSIQIENIPEPIKSDSLRSLKLQSLLQYVNSKDIILNSTKWIERVKHHMYSEFVPPETLDDYELLSRFVFTRICFNANKMDSTNNQPPSYYIHTWNEWIEPLTITARHPFSFGSCRKIPRETFESVSVKAGRSDVDYVLLQSGYRLYNHSHVFDLSPRKISIVEYSIKSERPDHLINQMPMSPEDIIIKYPPQKIISHQLHRAVNEGGNRKHYLFDAGTSTFDSSLFWFTCGYSQRKISYDQVYGWEMTLLEPNNYWQQVPSHWKPYWHFYNVPIHSSIDHTDSPLRMIQQIAKPNDFVSFKLDIDHPDTELPIALQILNDPQVTNLIDEFFFEFHFRCDVMTSCGWGKKIPTTSHGFILDRPSILKYFRDLRVHGIRAHIWP